MKNCLILPDIHGRTFWKKQCVDNIENYDKIIFLGDYLDPYAFENISVEDTIENFKEIIDFKKNNPNKVILLIGNHDLPYFSNIYYSFSMWHCRHTTKYHNEIHKLFEENAKLFQIAYVYNDILFTHAGVESGWLYNIVKCKENENINQICKILNDLINTKDGLQKLFKISRERGGMDKYPSCVWADVHDIIWDNENDNTIKNIKQIFGHTLQAYYDHNRNVKYGEAIEFNNCKMIDTTIPYVLDTENFKIQKV